MSAKHLTHAGAVVLALVVGAILGNAMTALASPTVQDRPFAHLQATCSMTDSGLACAMFNTETGELWRYGGSTERPVEYLGRLVTLGRALDPSRYR